MSASYVEHIHIAPAAGAPMQRVVEASAVRGVGLAGDRYWARAGFWTDDRVSRDLTLVQGETIDWLERRLGHTLEPGETRRNVTTRGVELNDLVNKTFWVGDALVRGTSLCEPCRHLVEVTGKSLLRPLVHRGGLRADLLSSGRIRAGDSLEVVDLQDGVGVIVARGDRVLVGRRIVAHGFGTWAFPGGRPLPGESVEECAIRELSEETGLVGIAPRVVAATVDGFSESRVAFHTTFVAVPAALGEPRALEPHKTGEWSWRRWESLPNPLFGPVASLVATGFNPMQVP
jgi:ADP-ribose pyrophosphatase YjhB (NUDIX family)